jgi:hypothetical protein
VGLLLDAGGDGVDGVLEQLAQVDPRAGVEVVRQQVDDPAEVDVEGAVGPRHALIQTDHGDPVDLGGTPDRDRPLLPDRARALRQWE